MTDARLPGRWLNQLAMENLSDRAFRTFTNSLMFSAEQGTDGAIPKNVLRLLHPEGVDAATAGELVAAGKWEKTATGYLVSDWEKHQSLAADVEWQHERNRLKNAAMRARNRGAREGVTGHETGEMTESVTGDETVLGGGEARQGQAVSSRPRLVPTSKSQTEMAVVDQPDDDVTRQVHAAFAEANSPLVRSCSACQIGMVFEDRPCPEHQMEIVG